MPEKIECVILVHGLWMNGLVFLAHQHWLGKEGFAVRRFSYPSWAAGLEPNADRLAGCIAKTRADRIHVIAHSLGGLVTLAMLEERPLCRIGRVVLMGTPCAGCYCGHYLAATPALSPLLGHSMKDWFTRPHPELPPAVEIGTIAGCHSWGLGRIIPGLPAPNDGVVSVEETRLACATDSIVLPTSHSGMLLSPTCAEQAASFLRTGSFNHA